MGDTLQSIGVIIAAIIIYVKPEWKIADPICTFCFAIMVIAVTFPVAKDCYYIFMETAPIDLNVDSIKESMMKVKGVESIEDFHLWAVSGDKNFLTAHIKLDEEIKNEDG